MPLHSATFQKRQQKQAINSRRRSKNPNTPVDVATGYDHYAIVMKRLGTNRLQIKLDNGNEVQAVIPGRFMKKIWFNVGDYIHVKREGEQYYDIIQKILNENELQNARNAIQKKLDVGEQDIFRPDIKEDESEDDEDFNMIQEDDSNDDKSKQLSGSQITSDKIVRHNMSVDKLKRKQQQKDRDQSRRTESEFIEKPISIVQKEDIKTVSENSTDEVNIDMDDINIDDI